MVLNAQTPCHFLLLLLEQMCFIEIVPQSTAYLLWAALCLTQWQVIRHNGFAVVVLYVRGPLCCWDSPHDPSKTCRCLSLWASGEMQFPLKTVFILYLNLTWIVWKGYIFVLPRCKITAKINLSHLKVCPGQTPRGEKIEFCPLVVENKISKICLYLRKKSKLVHYSHHWFYSVQ